jgi:hypothetical protein
MQGSDPGAELGLVTLAGIARRSMEQAYAGTYSIKLRSRMGLPGPSGGSTATWPSFAIASGKVYLFSCRVWGFAPAFAGQLQLQIDRGDGVFVELYRWIVPVTPSAWVLFTGLSWDGLGAVAKVRFKTDSPGPFELANDYWYVDELVVEELELPGTQVSISNMALSRIGVKQLLSSLSEDSAEAGVVNLHYDTVLRIALRQCDWQFARVRKLLVVSAGTPPAEWAYQYALPADLIKPLRIQDSLKVRRSDQRIPYTIETVAGVRLLYTDEGSSVPSEAATLVYTRLVTDPSLYDDSFINYLAWALAYECALALTGSQSRQHEAKEQREMAMQEAIADNLRSEQEPQPPDSEFIATRQ